MAKYARVLKKLEKLIFKIQILPFRLMKIEFIRCTIGLMVRFHSIDCMVYNHLRSKLNWPPFQWDPKEFQRINKMKLVENDGKRIHASSLKIKLACPPDTSHQHTMLSSSYRRVFSSLHRRHQCEFVLKPPETACYWLIWIGKHLPLKSLG